MKKILILIILFLALLFSYYQIKFEIYINKQKETYNILHDRDRISYIPVVIYYCKSLFDNKNLNKNSVELIMKDYKVSEMKVVIGYDEYIMECYYSKSEKMKFIESLNSNP